MAPRTPRKEVKPISSRTVTPAPKTDLDKYVDDPSDPKTFLGKIVKDFNELTANLLKANPDVKHNKGSILGEIFMWNTIAALAKSHSDHAWDRALQNNIIVAPDAVGEHTVTTSPRFAIECIVTEKVRKFDPDTFAAALKKAFRVPEMRTKEELEKAKVPTKSQWRYKAKEIR